MNPFTNVYREAIPHGIVVGVSLPQRDTPIAENQIERLLPPEQAIYENLRGVRKAQFLGGRIAAHEALRILGQRPIPILTDSWGAPSSGNDYTVSISHKDDAAFALVARSRFGTIGLDYERIEPQRMQVASKVLTPEEMSDVLTLPEVNQWNSVLIRFSVKEAIYKALAPRLKRYIAFGEANVWPGTDGQCRVVLNLESELNPIHLEAQYRWLDGAILSSVRAQWA